MSIPRYLTKSRFKLGLECATKLYYTGKSDIYADQNFDDPFLRSLADGGFQVGELAKFYFPGGVEIGRGDYSATAEQTRALIEAGDCTIYEAAFLAGDLFIYADVVERRSDVLNLYEVKAKSIDPVNDFAFTTGSFPAGRNISTTSLSRRSSSGGHSPISRLRLILCWSTRQAAARPMA